MMYNGGLSAKQIAKKIKINEATIRKILGGTYVPCYVIFDWEYEKLLNGRRKGKIKLVGKEERRKYREEGERKREYLKRREERGKEMRRQMKLAKKHKHKYLLENLRLTKKGVEGIEELKEVEKDRKIQERIRSKPYNPNFLEPNW